jgi:deoxyribodipyrimidine photo-lyase
MRMNNPPNIRIQKSRIRVLNDQPVRKGKYVLYWMQQSQRAEFNHALEYAVEIANHYALPVWVLFVLMDGYPDANMRHYTFMMEGLIDIQTSLSSRGITMRVNKGDCNRIVLDAGKKAAAIVCDMGYLKHQRLWRKTIAKHMNCRMTQVESDVVVPVETASSKAEYGAYTLRPKINRLLDEYLVGIPETPIKNQTMARGIKAMDLKDPGIILKTLSMNTTGGEVPPVSHLFYGGTSEAKKRFDDFLKNHGRHYAKNSNQPQTNDISHMGPYLHFGQISPLYLALKIREAKGISEDVKEKFLEQLIVRRELSSNFVYYQPGYDRYSCLPGWAAETLSTHLEDKREYVYNRKQLESAKTHDPYWNASMKEMKHTGYMHNYMRMYWAKKVIEWSKSPETAFRTLLDLNNKYFIDGRDPNSYAGVAWAFGLHDRPWKERPIFGKVRYMAAGGLERKCDIKAYVKKVETRINEMK